MKIKILTIAILSLMFFTNCSDSTSEEFNDNNPDAVARYITNIDVISAQDSNENTTITINYDSANRVTSISNGEDTSLLTYENGNLSNVTDQNENLSVEELYESPYDAFETGEVINYNSDGNPENLRFFETEYDWETDSEITTEYRAEIEYDNKPNPYFYTLQAAGAIAVLDNVELNFSADINAPEIVQARLLFPSKHIKKITYKDLDGNILFDVVADFVYNSDNYPTSGSITGTEYDSEDGDDVSVYSVAYTYQANN
ncbi:hypothetical protein [Psychroserpens damuponensis]|uniref:hypothetical protein n=1 Tax=Psychroserpens damuponensis TaxID=943936 RepID=UPI00058ED5A3|nr:hypothetical protein [Psychroserpens damuponensis]